jgi:hypothetical protein
VPVSCASVGLAMALELINVAKSIGFHILCLVYTFYVICVLGFTYVMKGKKIFEVKHREEPEQLKNEEYGVHKYIQVNVCILLYSLVQT